MAKFKIHVVGFESNSMTAGFDWYFKKADADIRYSEILREVKEFKEFAPKSNPIAYRGTMKVNTRSNQNAENLENEITELVELFLVNNGWENSFNKKKYQ